MSKKIYSTDNSILFVDKIDNIHINLAIDTIDELIRERDIKNIVLDFSLCKAIFAVGVLRLISYVDYMKLFGISFKLYFGGNIKLEKLMINQNWASLIDDEYPCSTYKGTLLVPALRYKNIKESEVVQKTIVKFLLSAYPQIYRSDFAPIEWTIGEVMDNVINHSESPCGGIVQFQIYRKSKKIELVVSDSGIGIPNTLREKYSKYNNVELLLNSIKEGVTNGKGMGNGLYGSSEISRISNGFFSIHSGDVLLTSSSNSGVAVRPQVSSFNGTTVYSLIYSDKEGLLEEALKFKNKKHNLLDYIELNYEMNLDESTVYTYFLDSEKDSLNSRISARLMSTYYTNLCSISEIQKVVLDFTKVTVISSSFADELFAIPCKEMGKENFFKVFGFQNCNELVQGLINRSFDQRGIL